MTHAERVESSMTEIRQRMSSADVEDVQIEQPGKREDVPGGLNLTRFVPGRFIFVKITMKES